MKETTKARLCGLIDEAIADGITAGMSMLVRKENEEVFYTNRGYKKREEKCEIRRDTIFRLYSMSKPITAAGAMILMEQGKLDLAQPVEEILPGFRGLQIEENGTFRTAKKPITSLHLLNMTSGLTYGGEDTQAGKMILEYLQECETKMDTEQAVTTEEFANHIGSIPLAFDPDSSWCYGLSADILGAVIEKVSGMRFGEFLEKYLFAPLGMKDTGFWVPEEKQHRLADAYETAGDGSMVPYTGNNLVISYDMKSAPAFESGGAGLVSTIDDYAKFAQMLLNGGSLNGIRVMSLKTVRFLTSGELSRNQQDAMEQWLGLEGYTYSHLMRRVKDTGRTSGLSLEGEYGWDGWLGCYFANFPKENMTILMMQQKKDAGTIPLTRKLRNVLLGE
ncbi:MAG: serine hydrolase domain-containing protein [Eubacteriales bacterium]|nr:serine hydrolase domain-containing protein [Eubacteriales bacterium]